MQHITGGTGPARCTVRATGESDGDSAEYRVRPEQASNAATIGAVASSRKLRERAVAIALATAIQESNLRNIRHGDRDSLGLFQQRPSQGWGDVRQILDPVYASGKFYDHLLKVPGYSGLPLTVAAQKVQRSGHPEAYAKHETNATLLAAALTGRRAAALNCTTGHDGVEKAGDPAAVRKKLAREFGDAVLDGPQEPKTAAARSGSHRAGGGRSEAKADIVLTVDGKQRGWELAHWALAHWSELHVSHISYGDHVWAADRSEDGWRESEDAPGDQTSVVLRLATAP